MGGEGVKRGVVKQKLLGLELGQGGGCKGGVEGGCGDWDALGEMPEGGACGLFGQAKKIHAGSVAGGGGWGNGSWRNCG